MADADALTISWTRAQADRHRTIFQSALGSVMLVETAAAIAFFACPVWSANTTLWPAPDAALWVRIVGAMWLVVNLFQMPALFDPVYQRWPNIVGLMWRFMLAALAAGLGGWGWAMAAAELAAAIGLAILYGRLFRAELLCRP